MLVRSQNHHEVSRFNSFVDRLDSQTGILRFLSRSRTRTQTDDDVDAGILQVVRMCVPLRTVTDDGNCLSLDDGKVRVFVVINFH